MSSCWSRNGHSVNSSRNIASGRDGRSPAPGESLALAWNVEHSQRRQGDAFGFRPVEMLRNLRGEAAQVPAGWVPALRKPIRALFDERGRRDVAIWARKRAKTSLIHERPALVDEKNRSRFRSARSFFRKISECMGDIFRIFPKNIGTLSDRIGIFRHPHSNSREKFGTFPIFFERRGKFSRS